MKENIQLQIFNNFVEVSKKAVDIFFGVHQSLNNRFYVVPGGKTPMLFFTLLAWRIKHWSNTQFILSDERLTHNKKLSNTAMFESFFIKKIKSKNEPLLIQNNLNVVQSIIENKLKSLTPKLAVLGLGTDGHTASLFPGNPEIFNENDDILIKTKNESEDFDRISLTFDYLMKAEEILFLVNGKEKAEALRECLEGKFNPVQYPAQFIFKNYNNDIHVLCDQLAAKYLA